MQKRLIKRHAHCPLGKQKMFYRNKIRSMTILTTLAFYEFVPKALFSQISEIYPDIGISER